MKKLYIAITLFFNLTIALAQSGSALDFRGVSSNYVLIPTNSSMNLSKFTIETWVYLKSSAAPLDFICAKGLEKLEIHTDPVNNRIRFIPTTQVYLDAANNSVPKNTWVHLACVYDPNNAYAKIYVNGVDVAYTQSGTGTLSTAVNANANDLILGSRNGGGFPLTGQLDEFRLWNRALSQAEIQSKMNCEIPTNAVGLILNYHFNQGTASGNNLGINTLLDATSNANNGNLSNNFALSGTTSNWVALGGIANGSSCAISGNTAGCNAVMLTVSGGVSYIWSGGDMPTSEINNFTASGLYTITITDDNMSQTVAAEYVTVSSVPSAPIVSSPLSFCGVGKISFLAAQGSNLKWYENNTGGAFLATNTTFTGQNTFYVSQSPEGCESTRAALTVFAKELSPLPTVAGVQSFCGTAYVSNLTALGQNLIWYYDNNYNNEVGQNDELEDDTYYVTQNTNGCESGFAPSQIIIISTPELYIEAMPSSIINAGENVDFDLSTYNLNGRPIFQWFIDNVPVGTNSGELIGSTFQNNAVVKCVITVPNGCLNNNVFSATQNISIRKTFSKNYSFLSSFGMQGNGFGELNSPEGLFMASNGYIYVSDYSNNRVSVWTQSGTNFLPLTSFGSVGSGPDNFNGATSVSVAPNGWIYAADYSGHKISIWTQDGINFTNINTFGSQGSAINQLNYPIDINFDANGHIFVCDYNNNRISVWTQSGNNFGVLTTFGGKNILNNPSSLVFNDKNQILISEYQVNKISVWTQSGNNFGLVTTFGGIDANSNQKYNPFKLFAGADNKIFFSDRYTNRIIVLTQSGNNFEKISEISGLGDNSFDFPSSVWETDDKKVHIVDTYNNRISIWQPCLEPSTIVTHPVSVSKCPEGPAAVFSVSVAGITPVQYEWSSESSNPSITVSGKSRGSFNVKVSGCGTFVSNYAKVNTIPQTEIENTLETQLICANTFASFTISALGENLKYAWSDGITTTTSFMTSTLGTSVTVTVSGTCGTEISSTAMVYGVAGVRIETQPVSLSTCAGASVTFDMFATGEGLKYVWTNGLSTTTSLFTSIVGTNYNVTVSGTCGTEISNTVSLSTLAGTQIVAEPTSQTIQPNATANLSVSATGFNLSYLWNTNETVSAISNKPVGVYFVTVSGVCGSAISSATISGINNPQIITATVSGLYVTTSLSNIINNVLFSITGSGFANGASVTIGGLVLTNVSITGNIITGTIPAGSTIINPSNPTISVQNSGENPSAPIALVPIIIGSNPTSTTESFSILHSQFSISPNPSTGTFTLKSNEPFSENDIKVIDIIGKNVSYILNGNELTISKSGVYFININGKVIKAIVE